MKKTDAKVVGLVVGAFLAVILCIVTWLVSINNTTVNLEEQILESDSAIEVQEKRREDLIVNLVDCVVNYADYEHKTLKEVTEARTAAKSGDRKSVV